MSERDMDHGVASKGFVCQNLEEHPTEVLMLSGPHDGVVCPECGRTAGGPDMEIPYTDPRGRNDRQEAAEGTEDVE